LRKGVGWVVGHNAVLFDQLSHDLLLQAVQLAFQYTQHHLHRGVNHDPDLTSQAA
jgi:hypothetical protein